MSVKARNDIAGIAFDLAYGGTKEVHLLSDRVLLLVFDFDNNYTNIYPMLSGILWEMARAANIDIGFLSLSSAGETGEFGCLSVSTGDVNFSVPINTRAWELTMDQFCEAIDKLVRYVKGSEAYQNDSHLYWMCQDLDNFKDFMSNHTPIYREQQLFTDWNPDWENIISTCWKMAVNNFYF